MANASIEECREELFRREIVDHRSLDWLRHYFHIALGADSPMLEALQPCLALAVRPNPASGITAFLLRVLQLMWAVLRSNAPSLTSSWLSSSDEWASFVMAPVSRPIEPCLIATLNFAEKRIELWTLVAGLRFWSLELGFDESTLILTTGASQKVTRRFYLFTFQRQLDSTLANLAEMCENELLFGKTPCARCRKSERGRRLCQGCGSVYYCNDECAQRDWEQHRPDCLEPEDGPLDAEAPQHQP